MPTKYQCKVCCRSFVHKETLKEHKLLHGVVILGGNKFSCPICQREVSCQSGVHQHGKDNCSPNVRDQRSHEKMVDDVPDDEVHAPRRSKRDTGIKLRLKNKNSTWKETSSVEIADASVGVSCKICSRPFVYQKCLQKHMTLVHRLSSEDGSNSDDLCVDNVVLSHQTKTRSHLQPVMNEDCAVIACGQNGNEKPCVASENSVLDSTKEFSPRNTGQVTVVQTSMSADLKVDPSDLKCKTCLKQFKHKAMLLRHMNMIHGETDFERCSCPVCSQTFSSQGSFSKHFGTEHKTKASEIIASMADGQSIADDGIDVVQCEKCDQWFTCRKSFQKHWNLKHHDRKAAYIAQLNHKSPIHSDPSDVTAEISLHEDIKLCAGTTVDDSELSTLSDNKLVISETGSSMNTSLGDVSDESTKLPKYSCSTCGKMFVTVNFLDRHMRIKHSSAADTIPIAGSKLEFKTRKQTFVCGYCSEEFDNEDALAGHVAACHQDLGLDSTECVCPVCGCTCPNQMLFSMHYSATHYVSSPASFLPQSVDHPVCRCSACELWFTNEAALTAHRCAKQTPVRQAPKTGRARYRCMQCGEAFEILRRFLHHRKVKHRVVGPDKTGTPDSSQPLNDLQSPTTAPAVNGLQAGSSQYSRGRPPKADDAQAKQDGSVDDVDQKQNDSVHEQPAGSSTGGSLATGGGSLKCPECGQVFAAIAQLRRHRKSEHRNRMCQLCGETCKSADMVYYHNLKYHHEQKCEVCGASCSGRLGLIDHFRAQHPAEPLPLINRKTLICEYCPRVFAGCASRLLRDHIESCHLGRVHLCDVCGKRLGSAQTLAVHRRMHDPVARFECHECNRRFPHNTNLMNHIRKHHPERLPAKYMREFRCEVCSMQFGSSSGLSRHRSEKHGSQRFQCDMCLRVFPSVTGLRIHKRRDHQPKESLPPSVVAVPSSTTASTESVLSAPPPQVVAPFSTDPTNAIMAGFMANMIGLPGLGQSFQ